MVTPTAYFNSNLALNAGQHVIDNNDTGDFSYEHYDVIVGGAVSGNGGLDIGSVNDASTGPYVALARWPITALLAAVPSIWVRRP